MATVESHRPIFIGGAGRSGTSLLRVMLDSHPDVCCGPELKALPEVAHLWSLLNGPIAPVMQAYGNSRQHINNLFRELIYGLVENLHRTAKKTRWAEKTPHNILQIRVLGEIFPQAHFLHVMRDGRDVACSLVTMDWFDQTGQKVSYVRSISNAARYWRSVVETARRQAAHPSLLGRVLEVRYEALVRQTSQTLRQVLEFVGLPWNDMLLSHQLRSHVFAGNESSDDQVQQPLHEASIGRWRRDMHEQDKADFKRETGELLQELGYVSGDW